MRAWCYILTVRGRVCYVGKSTDLKNRLRAHKHDARWGKSQASLYLYLRSCGVSHLRMVAVSSHRSEHAALKAEMKLIGAFKSAGVKLLNSLQANESFTGLTHSRATRETLRKKAVGQPQSAETRRRRSQALKGRVFSAEHRRRLSMSAAKRRWSAADREKLSRAHLGKKLSAAARKKLSVSIAAWWAKR